MRPAARFEARMTSRLDGRYHRIADDAASAGYAAGDGAFEALCGHRVRPTAMVSPDGPDCPACVAFQPARDRPRERRPDLPHRHRRPGLLRRLFQWLRDRLPHLLTEE
ncbi:MAG: hypothetical protein ACRDRH_00460 [Pseudonocardia sp.]